MAVDLAEILKVFAGIGLGVLIIFWVSYTLRQ